MKQEETLSARVRAIVAYHGSATLEEVQADVPEATGQLMFALAKAGHLVRTGAPRAYVYSPGKAPRVYGGTPEQRRATRDARNARMRERYAEDRGGLVRPRRRPGSNPPPPTQVKPAPPPNPPAPPRAAVGKARKPDPRQQIQVSPSYSSPFSPPPQRHRQLMTSQEWEATGGVVERLPNGAVSRSVLRHTYTA